jgi:amino acid adenylation domain-containing protein
VASTNMNIRDQLAGLSAAKRSLLELRLMKRNGNGNGAKQVIPRHGSVTGPVPLSYNQQGLWVLSQLMPGASLYHTPTAARLTGALDIAVLKQTLNVIVERHQALRTTFRSIEGTPMQVIAEHLSIDLPVLDLTSLPESEREEEARRLLTQEARQPFDLATGPLIRSILVRLHERDHILLVTTHHIVTDGWSVGILHRELMALYEAFVAGRPSPLPDLPIQYTDYALWHREWFEGVYEAQLAYWKKQFAMLPPPLELPADHSRPNVQAYKVFRGAQHIVTLSKKLTSELKQFCQKEGVTLFMTLLAAYKVLLHRYSGEADIVVGSPIAGRRLPETESLIGLFINTLALRTDLSGNPTFRELLARVKETSLGAYANQDLPFAQLVKELQPERTLAHNPLFQVMFVLQNEQIPPLELPGLAVQHLQMDHDMTDFDLTLDISERDERLVCLFEANGALFEDESVARMTGHFQMLLEGIVTNAARRVSELPLLTDTERHQLLVDWTSTRTDYPANKSIQELFEEQVARTPEAVAIVCDGEQLTYRELNRLANQLARYLIDRQLGPESRIGVCIERSPAMIVALLAVLKAGGAYVPLDPLYPRERLEFMVLDADVPVVLTQHTMMQNLPVGSTETICLDLHAEELALESGENLNTTTSPDSLAYVMYTSGSTGRPKGVAVEHRNVVRLVRNTNYATLTASEVLLQFAPISFDAATFEIWGSLLNGAKLALMSAGTPTLGDLGNCLRKYEVSTLWLTAGLFHLMVDNQLEDLKAVRQLLAGGDVLSVPHVLKAFRELKDCRLINGYGPTENTTFTCCYPITDPASINGSVPIGRPISNTYVYVLDQYLNPAPIGVPGELCIGGEGLARGYLNRPELTAERFIRDPFSGDSNARLYRTGDLVRYRPNSEIEFLGRIDNQVKVRGYRIELGEVEAVLSEHPGVREAVVIVRQDEGDKHLVAYLVLAGSETLLADDLREFLSRKLPDHMVPSIFVVLEALPLSPNGKVDRGALPAPDGRNMEMNKQFVAPKDELELKLLKIWERVLGVKPICVHDNFFNLGGHSLLAVKLFAQIEKAFGKNLPLATLFQAPTVAQLARVLREKGWTAPWSSLVLIQAGGSRLPFFCVHAAGGNVIEYHDLARLLGPDQPFYGLQAHGLDGREAPHTSIKEMAAHYLKEMREVQPEGPYLIGGRSSGGLIAFEMACRLRAEGEEVGLLALLDAYPAGYFKLLPGAGAFGQRLRRSARKFQSHANNLRRLGPREAIDYIFSKLSYAPAKIKHKVYRRAYKLYQRFGRPLPPVLRNIEELNFTAVKDYMPQVYDDCATLFLASALTASYDLCEGWNELVTGGVEVIEIPGNHINIIKEPYVRVLADKLRSCLDRAQEVEARSERAA